MFIQFYLFRSFSPLKLDEIFSFCSQISQLGQRCSCNFFYKKQWMTDKEQYRYGQYLMALNTCDFLVYFFILIFFSKILRWVYTYLTENNVDQEAFLQCQTQNSGCNDMRSFQAKYHLTQDNKTFELLCKDEKFRVKKITLQLSTKRT